MAESDAKLILGKWLNEPDYPKIGQAIANGYSGCNHVMRNNVLFSSFAIGRDFRSRLLGICVEYELDKMCLELDGFSPEIAFNKAKNCLHLRIHKDGLVITSHFMGKNIASIRSSVRIAKNRAILADRNGDLFADCFDEVDISDQTGAAYCQIMHGGFEKPVLSMLVVPNQNQHGILAKSSLPIPEPEIVSEEKIEEYVLRLKSQTEEFENGNVTNTRGLSA